ncbi:hypothetical protein [Alysiella crassa]|uniref:EF hand n=1 Tax=Alysiella crassa TaxID=153491 RepID=A0A376BLG4_9NEIS|nr:hypothetical protein [Alysiella crassa]UOP07294.1 UDP-glucose 6-dehydrogenase [Alysiella crassa]SSY70531.1 Uncharacterised protein [Alysiella crassa]
MKKQLFCAIVLASMATPAWACSQLPAFQVFMAINDVNKDGALSRREFLNAKLSNADFGNNLRIQFKLNKRTFRRLDSNRDGMLRNEDQNAWYDLVQYKRAPCADWEEEMQRMIQQDKSRQTSPNSDIQETIWLPAQ